MDVEKMYDKHVFFYIQVYVEYSFQKLEQYLLQI